MQHLQLPDRVNTHMRKRQPRERILPFHSLNHLLLVIAGDRRQFRWQCRFPKAFFPHPLDNACPRWCLPLCCAGDCRRPEAVLRRPFRLVIVLPVSQRNSLVWLAISPAREHRITLTSYF